MRKDAVIGLVGTLILAAALVGVFRFQPAPAGDGVAPRLGNVTLAPREGNAAQGQAYVVPVEVQTDNLTRLDFRLEFAQKERPPSFNLTVRAPDGRETSREGSGGLVNVTWDVAPVPATRAGANATAGQGEWVVTVRLVQAGSDVAVPVTPPTIPGQDPPTEAWTLKAMATTYAWP